jgi:hypothetical protein
MSEPVSPAHERLAALLLFLRVDAPRPSDDLREAVMRSIRRTHVLRSALAAVQDVLEALANALAVVLGLRPPPAPRVGTA